MTSRDLELSVKELYAAHYRTSSFHSVSPNGWFKLFWKDNTRVFVGNKQSEDPSEYWLVDGEREVISGNLPIPRDGRVVDNGHFVLHDGMWAQKQKPAILYAFNQKGEILWKIDGINTVLSNGLSRDGRYYICLSGRTLYFFDWLSGEKTWETRMPRGMYNVKSYEFDVEAERIYLLIWSNSKFAFSFSGHFLDADKWDEHYENLEFDRSGIRISWRSKTKPESLKLRRNLLSALMSAPDNGWKVSSASDVRGDLEKFHLIDQYGALTRRGRVEAILRLPLEKQCEYLGIPLIQKDADDLDYPEISTFIDFAAQGYTGGRWKGEAILYSLYAICFPVLMDSLVESRGKSVKYHPPLHMGDFYEYLTQIEDNCVNEIITTSICKIDQNLKLMKGRRRAEFFMRYTKYPGTEFDINSTQFKREGVDVEVRDIVHLNMLGMSSDMSDIEVVSSVYKCLGKSRLAETAKLFFADPYAFVVGWPDLTFVDPKSVFFVEVKTTDKLHRSQIITMGEMREKAGLDMSVIRLRKI